MASCKWHAVGMRGKFTMAFYLNPYSTTLGPGKELEIVVDRTNLPGRGRSDSAMHGNSCSRGIVRRGRYITWEN